MFVAACLLVVALVLLVVVHGLGAIGTISGVVAAVSAAASLGFQLVDRCDETTESPNLLVPHLRPTDALIDRADEMERLLADIATAGIVNCHGQRGAGKSFLLEHLADVVNGHRPPARDHPVPGPVVAALYFDLADAVGFEQISADVCRSAVGSRNGSWAEFVDYVVGAFPKRDVLLILDNVNTPALWPSLGKAAYRYLASRPNDKLILGSIDPVTFDNLAVKHLEVSGLTEPAIAELVRARGTEPEPEFVAVLREQYDGLPFYVQLLTPYEPELAQQDTTSSSILDVQLIPQLAGATKRLMAYIALLGVISRQVLMSELERCPIADAPGQVVVAIRHSLLSRTSERRSAIKIHDIVRDAVLRTLHDEVTEAAANLFDRAYQDEAWVDAAFFAMFTDPSALDPTRFDLALGVAINSAVESRNHALLSNLLLRAQQSARVLEFLSADRGRYDLFCYGRASQLAASGNYSDAEDALYGSSIARQRDDDNDEPTGLRSELRFLQADLAHLLNRYDEAAAMFVGLGELAAATGQARLEARCIWAQAHVLRHQGRELDRSLALFANAARLAESCDELFVKVHSVTGACGIRVALGTLADDEQCLLVEAEREVAATVSHDGYMLRIWKAQARVAWAQGSTERAWEIIEAAIDKALAVNDRALHNLRFERAEFHRLSHQPDEALVGYLQARQFAEEQGDRNLLASCLLGLVLTDVAAGDWVHFKTSADARAVALQAREIALAADVQMTAQVASQIVSMLDAPSPAASSAFRLIVF